jgi:hypothetical protein
MGRFNSRAHLTAALLTSTSLALLGAGLAAGASDSGVSGQVRVDGRCGIRAERCARHRVEATIVIRERDSGRRVRTVQTRSGRFRVRLKPGDYTLTATSASATGVAHKSVNVQPHSFALVVLRLHSPVRPPTPGRGCSASSVGAPSPPVPPPAPCAPADAP